MVAIVNAIPQSSVIGVNLNTVTTGTSTPGAGAPYALGMKVFGTDGGVYMMVQAGEAISTTTTQPFALCMTAAFQAFKITKALASKGQTVGIAPQIVISIYDFFWVRLQGTVNIKVAVSCAADTNLWTTATAGILDDTSGASHVVVLGIKLAVSASASQSAGSTVRAAIVTSTIVPQLIA